jgi:hypothetical protein
VGGAQSGRSPRVGGAQSVGRAPRLWGAATGRSPGVGRSPPGGGTRTEPTGWRGPDGAHRVAGPPRGGGPSAGAWAQAPERGTKATGTRFARLRRAYARSDRSAIEAGHGHLPLPDRPWMWAETPNTGRTPASPTNFPVSDHPPNLGQTPDTRFLACGAPTRGPTGQLSKPDTGSSPPRPPLDVERGSGGANSRISDQPSGLGPTLRISGKAPTPASSPAARLRAVRQVSYQSRTRTAPTPDRPRAWGPNPRAWCRRPDAFGRGGEGPAPSGVGVKALVSRICPTCGRGGV